MDSLEVGMITKLLVNTNVSRLRFQMRRVFPHKLKIYENFNKLSKKVEKNLTILSNFQKSTISQLTSFTFTNTL